MAIEVQLISGLMDYTERLLEGVRRDWYSIDLNALRGFLQMRRGEESGANARGAKPSGDHGARGALSVRARNVNNAECALRITQSGEHCSDPIQAQLGGLDLVAEGVKKLYRFRIIHALR